MTSKQLTANRANARLSRGPKDTSVSRFNSLKHGLLAKDLVVTTGDGAESRRAFLTLLSQLRQDLGPEGVLEEMLLERIAICYWRLRRAVRGETGEIRKGTDSAVWDVLFGRGDQHRDDLSNERMSVLLGEEGSRPRMIKSTMGISHMLEVLDEIKACLEESGVVPGVLLQKALRIWGKGEDGLATWLFTFSNMAEHPEEYPDAISPERCKVAMVAMVDSEKEKLENLKPMLEEKEKLELEAEGLARSLPTAEVLDKITRYETTIERQMYRAVKELRELQAARLGLSSPSRRVSVGVQVIE